MSHSKPSESTKRVTITYHRNEAGQFVCPECGAIKRRQNSMHYHMKKHAEERGYTCMICNKGFLQKQTLDLHLRSKHPERRSSASAASSSDSDTVSSSSEDGKSYHCPFDACEFRALTKGNCIIHCVRVHFQEEIRRILTIVPQSKEHRCAICDKSFSSATSFYYHCKLCLVPILPSNEKQRRLLGVL